jgi:hypothetical protein
LAALRLPDLILLAVEEAGIRYPSQDEDDLRQWEDSFRQAAGHWSRVGDPALLAAFVCFAFRAGQSGLTRELLALQDAADLDGVPASGTLVSLLLKAADAVSARASARLP